MFESIRYYKNGVYGYWHNPMGKFMGHFPDELIAFGDDAVVHQGHSGITVLLVWSKRT